MAKTYAKKTCNICSATDTADNMQKAKKSTECLTSRDKIGFGTYVGAVFGAKVSTRRISKTLFGNNKRGHTNHRMVWMCLDCADNNKGSNGGIGSDIGSFISGLFGYGIVLVLRFALVAGFIVAVGQVA